MFELSGLNALVTGATGGLGGQIARALHAQGANVGLSGTRAEALEALVTLVETGFDEELAEDEVAAEPGGDEHRVLADEAQAPGAGRLALHDRHLGPGLPRLPVQGLVEARLAGHEFGGHQPVHLVPGRGDVGRDGRAQHLAQRGQQVATDDGVLRGRDAQADVLVGDAVQHGGEGLGPVHVRGEGVDRAGQGLGLVAAGLVAQVEEVLQLGVVREHALVEVPGDGFAVGKQHRHGGLDEGAGGGREHGVSRVDAEGGAWRRAAL